MLKLYRLFYLNQKIFTSLLLFNKKPKKSPAEQGLI